MKRELQRLLDDSRFLSPWGFRVVKVKGGECTLELPGGMKINMLTMGSGGPGAGPNAEQMAAMRKAMAAAKKRQQ